jgi:geranylgeranyl reductase family protein
VTGGATDLLPDWQQDAATLPDGGWDAVVVGGGPSGSTAALHLAASGHRVLLLERHAYPRDKACGDLLIPDALGALRRAGLFDAVAAEARQIREAVISSPSRIEWSIPGEYLVLRRQRFDMLLAEGAARRGATVARGRVERVVPRPDGGVDVHVRDRARPLPGRMGIMATGADVSLIDQLGMVERAAPTAVAVRAYVRSQVEIEPLVISFDREIVPGYAWIFPLPDHEYNVGVGALHDPGHPARHDLRALFETFCREVPDARRLMASVEEMTPLRGARLRCGLDGARARGPGNVVAVGEQIGTTFPFTGEGIGKAMETGEMAAEQVALALEAGDPAPLDGYAERLERELRPRYHGYLVAQRWLGRPWLNDLVSRRMRRGGWMAEAARGIVSETVDPADVFSWRGLLRSVVG